MLKNAFENEERGRVIVRTSVFGIVANILLSAFKAAVGLLSGSIAIILDAVNNLSDAASSLITIIGTRLAAKSPDKRHPFGYGRVEYLSAMIISLIVLYAGVTSLVESIKKIISPEVPEYSKASLVIVAAAVIVKILMGRYVLAAGKKVNSDSLVNSGKDAALDALISFSTLLAAVVFIFTGVSLEAWLGAVISLLIIKSGIEMLGETLSEILGERADTSLARSIKETVLSFKEVGGAYDLVLNNYGPDAFNGSIHIEVPDTCTASDLDELIRAITLKVLKKHNVLLTAIGVYSVNTKDNAARAMQERIKEKVFSHENVIEMHGFYVNEAKKSVRFDLVVSFDEKDRHALLQKINSELEELYPDYTMQIVLDVDFATSSDR